MNNFIVEAQGETSNNRCEKPNANNRERQFLLIGIGFVTCEVRLFSCALGYGHTFSDGFSR